MEVDSLLEEVNQLDEITFWSRQMAEHALFLSKALSAGQEQLKLLSLDDLIDEGKELYNLWIKIFNMRRENKIVPKGDLIRAVNILRSYKQQIYHLSSQEWIGFAFPAEVEHYLDELDYLEKIINGIKLSEEKERLFWLDVSKDHAALIMHLLDPKEKAYFEEAFSFVNDFEKLDTSSLNYYIHLSALVDDFNDFTATLREKQAVGKLLSIINPRLALHIHREGLRAIYHLNL